MTTFGYWLSCEEHPPNDLVHYARRAEEVGFSFGMISDHFHPWLGQQGQSPFVWSVIGGIAQATEQLRLGTGVTCPTMRMHPVIVAHAAATAATMMPERFFLGVGTGERLNEHILGNHWPPPNIRLEMLEEAIEVIRGLWSGKMQRHWGHYYTVENARLYTLPATPPQLLVAATGKSATATAARQGDGLIAVVPQGDMVEQFHAAGGAGKPCYGQIKVCWAQDDAEARHIAHTWFPTEALPGKLLPELPTPTYFEQAVELLGKDAVAEAIVCSADPERHITAIRKVADAGFDHICIHQVGPDQEGFFRFYQQEVLPNLA
ncbi:MAG: TIGR03557 family F420-dependent LLM class oxidoreductase [Chloroflexaceae bacterium]